MRAFCDANDDGIGDFRGLTGKLDYLAGPGRHRALAAAVLSLALEGRRLRHRRLPGRSPDVRHAARLPHFPPRGARPRPARDHRTGAQPHVRRASLVPARADAPSRAAAGATIYVWSDTPDRYKDARIIFQDFEPSNWTWDPVARAYYWHRFYRHQPDLNFDNPEVRQALLQVMDHWFGMGVDGHAARRRAVSLRARRHELREPAGNARLPEGAAGPRRCAVPGPHAPGRGEPMAGGRRQLLRQRRRMSRGLPLSA